jgi:hypothetical protein
MTAKNIDFAFYGNADFRYIPALKFYRGFHVVRDPRDIIVSAYYSHKYSHPTKDWPELVRHREILNSVDKDSGLIEEIHFREEQFNEMASWPKPTEGDPILQVRMEDLTANPYLEFQKVFEHLGLLRGESLSKPEALLYFFGLSVSDILRRLNISVPRSSRGIPPERLFAILWNHRFEKMAGGRQQGSEDKKKHYRKGVAGDWRNHFKEDHIELIKSKYNAVILKYGYEHTEDWGGS